MCSLLLIFQILLILSLTYFFILFFALSLSLTWLTLLLSFPDHHSGLSLFFSNFIPCHLFFFFLRMSSFNSHCCFLPELPWRSSQSYSQKLWWAFSNYRKNFFVLFFFSLAWLSKLFKVHVGISSLTMYIFLANVITCFLKVSHIFLFLCIWFWKFLRLENFSFNLSSTLSTCKYFLFSNAYIIIIFSDNFFFQSFGSTWFVLPWYFV